MTGFLTEDEPEKLRPANEVMFPSPIPTQVVASDEFWPSPQTERQKRVEARIKEMADEIGGKQGMNRRRFLQTAAGMAAAFLAMNEVYGPLYGVSKAEAQTPGAADARAAGLANEFIFDVHTHFLRPDTRLMTFVQARRNVGQAGWNPALVGVEQTIEMLMEANWFKEMFLDSDTKVALISGAPSEDPRDWFLTNDMKFDARKRVNDAAGTRRVLSHGIFTPGQPGWMDEVERCLTELNVDSFKGYTVGDNTNKHLARHPWRMDDERLLYPLLRTHPARGEEHRLRPQGALSAAGDRPLPASRALCRRGRCGKGGEGLAADQLRHLPLRLSLDGRRRQRRRA